MSDKYQAEEWSKYEELYEEYEKAEKQRNICKERKIEIEMSSEENLGKKDHKIYTVYENVYQRISDECIKGIKEIRGELLEGPVRDDVMEKLEEIPARVRAKVRGE